MTNQTPQEFSKKRFFTETTSFGSPESYKWWRKASATKSKPPSSEKVKKTPFPKTQTLGNLNKKPFFSSIENAQSFKPTSNIVSNKKMGKTQFLEFEDEEERAKICRILKVFRDKCKEISLKASFSENGGQRVDFRAKEELTKEGKICISSSKIIGSVSGVNVGDRFEYRVELIIVGLHARIKHGIDYMMYNGKSLATCIVAKEGYDDKMGDSEAITYVGEGGMYRDNEGCFHVKDQKLCNGNLALKNSMIAESYVRVVRGFGLGGGVYVYDGLYKVVTYEQKRGISENLVFEFRLKRCPGQPVVAWNKFKNV